MQHVLSQYSQNPTENWLRLSSPAPLAISQDLHVSQASVGWFDPHESSHAAHYPSMRPELGELTSALHAIVQEQERRAEFMRDTAAYAENYKLSTNSGRP